MTDEDDLSHVAGVMTDEDDLSHVAGVMTDEDDLSHAAGVMTDEDDLSHAAGVMTDEDDLSHVAGVMHGLLGKLEKSLDECTVAHYSYVLSISNGDERSKEEEWILKIVERFHNLFTKGSLFVEHHERKKKMTVEDNKSHMPIKKLEFE